MSAVLVCTHALDVDVALGGTILGRQGVLRHVATKPDQARSMVIALRPALILVDRDLPWADRFIAAVREDADTRTLSVAVIARGDFDPGEVALLEAGANAILRFPPGPEWDDRVPKLMSVPIRKETRFSVHFQVETLSGSGSPEPALALNLSTHGMLVETPAGLSVGESLVLQFKLPDEGDEVRVKARVVRLAATDRYGVEFEEVGRDERACLGRFLGTLA
jgi:hypothetical protein